MNPFPLGLGSPGPRVTTSTLQNRNATRLMAIVAEHLFRGSFGRVDPQGKPTGRYLPHDFDGQPGDETACNLFVQDVAEAMGVEVPRNKRANDLRAWFETVAAIAAGWEKSDAHTGMAMAEQGCLAVASWSNPNGPGHLSVFVPSLGENGVWSAQAGRVCFTRDLLQRGFGAIAPDIFVHP